MNSLYAWGSNQFKKVSPVSDINIFSPTIQSDFENLAPSKTATGDNHTLVLNEYGDIYSFGRGIQGELGHGVKENLSTPKVIEGFQNEMIVDIACGSITSYAVTISGAVYNWGLIHAHSNNNSSSNVNSTSNSNTTSTATNHDNNTSNPSHNMNGRSDGNIGTVPQEEEEEYHAASAGELTGMAQDQTTTYVSVDTEARVDGLHAPVAGPRQLGDIVR